jgi:hypothetical protein
LRAITDAHIVSSWLIKRNDPDLYRRYVDFGRGRLKLYKLHVEDALDEDDHAERLADLFDHLEERVSADVLEEFQTVDLGGNFAGKSGRDMAIETGMRRLYNLVYQPLSAEAHGEWDSMDEHDLERSSDPLHFGHRFGVFSTRNEMTDLRVVGEAFSLAGASIRAIFDDLGVDVTPELEKCGQALTEALRAAKGFLASADDSSPG